MREMKNSRLAVALVVSSALSVAAQHEPSKPPLLSPSVTNVGTIYDNSPARRSASSKSGDILTGRMPHPAD
jgi:hypothetical protein